MNWLDLMHVDQLNDIVAKSHATPQLIFKHSTRCSISSMSKSRLERETSPDGVDFYLLDLIAFRNISNELATRFNVHHESPQILLIKDGECVYDESHNGIMMSELKEQIAMLG